MNILDIILCVFLLILIFNGFRKGFIKSVISLLGLVVIVIVIAKTGHLFKGMLIVKLGFGEILAVISSYILIAIIIILISKLVIYILHSIIEFLNLNWLNKLLGVLFGLFCGTLIIAIILIVLNISPFEKSIREFTSDSKIVTTVRTITDKLESRYPEIKDIKKPFQEQMNKVEKSIAEKTEDVEEKFKDKLINK
ncbi:MAG: CvpA family protein [Candidatus Cloacimonetes bacterium]|nr:CvpA family protein [Candidatus Cloacimonadota bacterium]